MKEDFLFKNFVKALHDRIPQRGQLADELTELLGIEKEAVYRRLRGSVPFSFQEIHSIATHLGFSLDSIGDSLSQPNRSMTVLTLEFRNMQEKDYQRLEDFVISIRRLKTDPNSESGAIGSIIPVSLCVNYDFIYKFYLFKWAQQFGNSHNKQSYKEIKISERLKQINHDFVESVQDSPKSVYILDRRFIEYFVCDIRFFFDIRLVSQDDVLQLKEDLHLLLNNIERYAVNGCFDTGNKAEIFLANVHFDANFNYIDSAAQKMTMIRSFAFCDSYSFDEAIFRNMKNWLYFFKRTSTLISEGCQAERIHFFEQQRKFVDSI